MIPVIDYLAFSLLSMRGACHLLICLRVITYQPRTSVKHKRIIGFVAALFAGLNLIAAIGIYGDLQHGQHPLDFHTPIIMLFVLLAVIWAGGNIARFLSP